VAPAEADWSKPERQTRAVREYLDSLEDQEPDPARKAPKVISLSDPASAWTAKANKGVQFGYGLNYLIDTENAVMVDVEATPAEPMTRSAPPRPCSTARTAFGPEAKTSCCRYRLRHQTVFGWLVGQRIAPHIPVWDMSQREDGTLSRKDFRFDKKDDVYFCPQGTRLKITGRLHNNGTALLYRASKYDCTSCSLKPGCCPKQPARKIPRDFHEAARDKARSLAGTEAFERSGDERKQVEMRFAHLETHHRFERMRLRWLSGARDEFHLAAIAQNLKLLASRIMNSGPQLAAA
jgi:Transposase DDE domain